MFWKMRHDITINNTRLRPLLNLVSKTLSMLCIINLNNSVDITCLQAFLLTSPYLYLLDTVLISCYPQQTSKITQNKKPSRNKLTPHSLSTARQDCNKIATCNRNLQGLLRTINPKLERNLLLPPCK